MLRIGVVASVLPLLALAAFTQAESTPSGLCFAFIEGAAQIASDPERASIRVGFTEDPARATVTVALVDSPEQADFAVADDALGSEAGGCAGIAPLRLVAITPAPAASEAVIRIVQGGEADYRLYWRSLRGSAREAAALLVGARQPTAIVSAQLAGAR